jgi:hypothetical protein
MFAGFSGVPNSSFPEAGFAGQLFMRVEARGDQASFAEIPAALTFVSVCDDAATGGST